MTDSDQPDEPKPAWAAAGQLAPHARRWAAARLAPRAARAVPRRPRSSQHGPPPSTSTALGNRLRYFREQAGLTQEDVARAAGLTTNYMQKIERARISPSIKALAAIAVALGIEDRLMELVSLSKGIELDNNKDVQMPAPATRNGVQQVGHSKGPGTIHRDGNLIEFPKKWTVRQDPNIKEHLQTHMQAAATRLVSLLANDDQQATTPTTWWVKAADKIGLVRDISDIMTNLGLPMKSFSAVVNEDTTATLAFSANIDRSLIDEVERRLRNLEGFLDLEVSCKAKGRTRKAAG